MIDEFVGSDRFSKKSFDSSSHHPIQPIALNESGTEKNRNVLADLSQSLECFLAVHERHCQVEQDKLEGMRLSPEKIERLEA